MPRIIGNSIKPDSQEGGISIGSKGETIIKFTMVYQVLGDSVNDTFLDILATTGIPIPKITSIAGIPCKEVDAKEVDTSISLGPLWEVEAKFDSTINDDNEEEDPTDWAPEWRWSFETSEEVLEYDAIEGKAKPIQNSVGEPLFVTVPIAIPTLRISRYQNTFSPQTILDYANHSNKTAFWGAPIHCALLAGIDDAPEKINNFKVRKVEYLIKFKIKRDEEGEIEAGGWILQLLDHGTKHKVFVDGDIFGTFVNFTDAHQNESTGNLDGLGIKLPDNQPPVFLPFHKHPEAELNTLNLGPW
jgi:hypothetical protein